jgi:hypothetical protein
MKKKSNSQSAFFNLRVLVGLFVGMTGISLALFGASPFGRGNAASASAAAKAQPKYKITSKSQGFSPLVPPGFDCSQIHQLGIDKMENLRAGAIMIFCGEAKGGSASIKTVFSKLVKSLMAPVTYGTTDVDLITGTETFPNITQSETMAAGNPDNPLQIVVAYNDSRGVNAFPINVSGASVSLDGGNTFTRLTRASGQSPFDNTFGDPVILYNKPSGTWFTVWLDGDPACGGFGLGGYKSTTPEDPNSWTHFCAHVGSFDDRESGWADNNPSSPHYGNMYVSWNDFTVGCGLGGCLFVVRSTDNGLTWSSPTQLSFGPSFIRNVQITGDLTTGDVYVAGMDEGGGGCGTTRANLLFKSTDGGVTWANTYTGPTFIGPCRSSAGYFATMYDNPPYWRHMGWGQPVAKDGIVNYVYGAQNGTDPGDVFAIHSTDGGVTFSAPFQLNSDTDPTHAQWQANLSVAADNSLLSVWYDERERVGGSCQPSGNPCYRMWARKSVDNGATWLPDMEFSDVVTPLPLQPDPSIVDTYAGDYDYSSSVLTQHLHPFVDGRVLINGASQQDAFHDREPIAVGLVVISADPACGSIINSQPTDFVINTNDAVQPGTVDPSDLTVNGIPADSVSLSNGNTTLTFTFNTSPVTTEGEQTMHIPEGAFLSDPDGDPVFEFNCTFRYDVTLLQVVDTVPPVGGTFSPPAPNDYTYDVNWSEPVDPNCVDTGDLQLIGNVGGSVTNVEVINGNMTTRFTVHFNFGGSVTAIIAAGAICDQFGNPNAAFKGSYTVEGCPPQDHYNITEIGGSIVPGETDTGIHCDDCTMTISLPFPYSVYDVTYNSITLSSNGNAQLTTTDAAYTNQCLPWLTHNYTIYPYWDDLYTINAGYGVYTSVTGSAPDRIFNIEWRAQYYPGTGTANFELRLYENQTRFDVIYGTVSNGNSSATAGVQKDDTAFDQYFCDGSGAPATGGQSYILQSCGTPTPTPTVTPSVTPTPTATPSVTPSATPSVTPTVTPSPTPTATPSATPTATATPSATPTATPGVCVFGQGYWKNHPEAWPVTELQLGNVTYTQEQLLAILREPVRGNGILILAKQEIAAKLNIANGADGSCIQQTLADADALIGDLVIPPIGDGYLRPRDVQPTAGILGDYNEGNLCAPSCDNSSPSPAPRPRPTSFPRPRP